MSSTGVRDNRSNEKRIAELKLSEDSSFIQSLKPFNSETISGGLGIGGGGGGNSGSYPVGDYLPRAGGYMLGAFGNKEIIVEIASNEIDVSESNGNFAPYIVLNPEGGTPDQLDNIIPGVDVYPNRELWIEVFNQIITFRHTVGNILTPDGNDFPVSPGQIVKLVYSTTQGQWVIVGSSGGVGGVTFPITPPIIDHGTVGFATIICDLSLQTAHVQKMLVNGDITIAFTNPPINTKNIQFQLDITMDPVGGHVITWPVNLVRTPNVDLGANERTIILFQTNDGGTTYDVFETTGNYVTNPMSADLDANFFSINNLGGLIFTFNHAFVPLANEFWINHATNSDLVLIEGGTEYGRFDVSANQFILTDFALAVFDSISGEAGTIWKDGTSMYLNTTDQFTFQIAGMEKYRFTNGDADFNLNTISALGGITFAFNHIILPWADRLEFNVASGTNVVFNNASTEMVRFDSTGGNVLLSDMTLTFLDTLSTETATLRKLGSGFLLNSFDNYLFQIGGTDTMVLNSLGLDLKNNDINNVNEYGLVTAVGGYVGKILGFSGNFNIDLATDAYFSISEVGALKLEFDTIADNLHIRGASTILFSMQEGLGLTTFTIGKFSGFTDLSDPTEINLQIAGVDKLTVQSGGVILGTDLDLGNNSINSAFGLGLVTAVGTAVADFIPSSGFITLDLQNNTTFAITELGTNLLQISDLGAIKYFRAGDLNGNPIINATYLESNATTPSGSGVLRMGYTEGIYWKDQAGSLDIGLIFDTYEGNTNRFIMPSPLAISPPSGTTPRLSLRNNQTSLGTTIIEFDGEDNAGAVNTYARISSSAVVATAGVEEGRLDLSANYQNLPELGIRIEGDSTGAKLGFFGNNAISKPTVSGSKGGNVALADLCTKLASLGLIINSTS